MLRQISFILRVVLMMVGIFTTVFWAPAAWNVREAHAATIPATGNAASTVPSGADAEAEYERAGVTLDGRVLFYVRSIPAYPAEERAKAISKRIEAIAAELFFKIALGVLVFEIEEFKHKGIFEFFFGGD